VYWLVVELLSKSEASRRCTHRETLLSFDGPAHVLVKLVQRVNAKNRASAYHLTLLADGANGRPLPILTAGDTENVATLISEAGSRTSTDFYETGHVVLGAYSFSSPRFVVSLEAFQDLNVNDEGLTAIALRKQNFSKYSSSFWTVLTIVSRLPAQTKLRFGKVAIPRITLAIASFIAHYLARAKDSPPGNRVIWRGLSRLTGIEIGFKMGTELVVSSRPMVSDRS
jgi:hypothetical protein